MLVILLVNLKLEVYLTVDMTKRTRYVLEPSSILLPYDRIDSKNKEEGWLYLPGRSIVKVVFCHPPS